MIILIKLIDVYVTVIVIRAIISWFPIDYSHPLYVALRNITDPVLMPIRKLLPTGGIDFSPFIVILILEFIKRLLVGG